ncbi:MAG: alpha/beta fold hydrolase [Thermoplasmatota archaeon]
MIKDDKIQLPDGRSLGFAEYGYPSGIPVFFFHGSAGSRYESPKDEKILTELKIRFISVDRPGHGLSDPMPDRTILDFANDIRQLADKLEIDRFHVLGWSAGGPYALACMYELKNRVRSGAIVSGLAPPDRPHPYKGLPFIHKILMFVMRNLPKATAYMRKGMYNSLKARNDKIGESISKSLIPEDRKVFNLPGIKESFLKDINEGYKQSWEGVALDDVLINRSWNFNLKVIQQRIDIWHGNKDKNVSIFQAQYQNEMLSNSRLHVMENCGHLFLLIDWEQVLIKLIE